jgi:inhibitor of cysteine peptidase
MKSKFHSIVLALILTPVLFITAGCGKSELTPIPPVASTTLTETDNGKTVNLKPGDMLVIRLAGNPTTGYSWEAQDLDIQVLEQAGEAEFESENTTPDLVGVGGTMILTFKAISTGTTTLTLVYHRPWEADVAPIQTFSVTVTVN